MPGKLLMSLNFQAHCFMTSCDAFVMVALCLCSQCAVCVPRRRVYESHSVRLYVCLTFFGLCSDYNIPQNGYNQPRLFDMIEFTPDQSEGRNFDATNADWAMKVLIDIAHLDRAFLIDDVRDARDWLKDTLTQHYEHTERHLGLNVFCRDGATVRSTECHEFASLLTSPFMVCGRTTNLHYDAYDPTICTIDFSILTLFSIWDTQKVQFYWQLRLCNHEGNKQL